MIDPVDEIIGMVEGPDPATLDRLGEADLDHAYSRSVDVEDPGRDRALAILAYADPASGGLLEQAVSAIVGNAESSSTSVANALALAAAIGPPVVPLVLGALEENGDETIVLAAWRTLAQVGEAASSEDLERFEALLPAGGVAAEEGSFAISVIAYRARLGGHELSVPEGELIGIEGGEETTQMEQPPVSPSDVAQLSRLGAADLYLVDSGPSTAIDCGENHMLVCLTESLRSSPESFSEEPALAGVILLLDPFDGGGLSVLYLIFSWPDEEGGVHLALHEPNGMQAYYSHAEAEAVSTEAATFDLGTVDQPGAARVSLTLAVTPEGVELTGKMLSATEIQTEEPEPEPEPEPE